MNEQIIYKQDGVLISSSRLIVAGSQTHLLEDITSTRIGEVEMGKGYLVLFILIGSWLVLEKGAVFALGGLFITAGIGLWVSTITKYGTFIYTSKAEYRVYASHDRLRVEKFTNALNATLASQLAPNTNRIINSKPAVIIKRVMQSIVP